MSPAPSLPQALAPLQRHWPRPRPWLLSGLSPWVVFLVTLPLAPLGALVGAWWAWRLSARAPGWLRTASVGALLASATAPLVWLGLGALAPAVPVALAPVGAGMLGAAIVLLPVLLLRGWLSRSEGVPLPARHAALAPALPLLVVLGVEVTVGAPPGDLGAALRQLQHLLLGLTASVPAAALLLYDAVARLAQRAWSARRCRAVLDPLPQSAREQPWGLHTEVESGGLLVQVALVETTWPPHLVARASVSGLDRSVVLRARGPADPPLASPDPVLARALTAAGPLPALPSDHTALLPALAGRAGSEVRDGEVRLVASVPPGEPGRWPDPAALVSDASSLANALAQPCPTS